MGKMLFLFVCIGGAVWVFYSLYQREKRWKELTREIARTLGKVQDASSGIDMVQDALSYEWKTPSGVSVSLGGGSAVVRAGAAATAVTKGVVEAVFPHPLPYFFSVVRGTSHLTDDEEFNRICRVQTDNDNAARALLADPGLRLAIKTLLHSSVRVTTINQLGVSVQFFDIKEYAEGARKALELAEHILRRAA